MKRKVMCGGIPIGGGTPVSIQTMTNTPTANVEATVDQCKQLASAGAEIIRVTVNTEEAAQAFSQIRKQIEIPLVADIHFDYTLALKAIDNGADKIRINPGNIGSSENLRKVADAAKKARIPIRVGVNSGSIEKKILSKYGGVTARGLAESAIENARLLEEMDFSDIVLSLKASDVKMNNEAYRIVDNLCDFPLHIGVTEAGTPKGGIVKSSIGIGSLLMDGIGDTLRVSLTADPVNEVIIGKEILKALDMRETGIDMRSCPTCGRTEVNLEKIANDIEERMSSIEKKKKFTRRLKVAVMGCGVNGPGEAKEADVGVACGKKEGLIFAKGEIIKKVREDQIVDEIARIVEEYEDL